LTSKWWASGESHTYIYHFVDLSQKEDVAKLISKDLERVNSYLPEDARVAKFVLLHKDLTLMKRN